MKLNIALLAFIIFGFYHIYNQTEATKLKVTERLQEAQEKSLYTASPVIVDKSPVFTKRQNQYSQQKKSEENQYEVKSSKSLKEKSMVKIDFDEVLKKLCQSGEDPACETLEGKEASIFYKFYRCKVLGEQCLLMVNAFDRIGEDELATQALYADCQINDNPQSCLETSSRMLASESGSNDDVQELLSIACDKKSARACMNLAHFYLEQGHQRLFDRHAKKACELDPEYNNGNCSQYQ